MKISALLLLAACGTDPKTIDVAIPGTQTLVTEKVNGGAWKKLTGAFDSAARRWNAGKIATTSYFPFDGT